MQTMALRLVSAAVYFRCVEALQNAAQYAGEAAVVAIRLCARRSGLFFAVRDTGVGFDPVRTTSGTGLANIVDRVGALGGRLAILARPCGSVPAAVVEQ